MGWDGPVASTILSSKGTDGGQPCLEELELPAVTSHYSEEPPFLTLIEVQGLGAEKAAFNPGAP